MDDSKNPFLREPAKPKKKGSWLINVLQFLAILLLVVVLLYLFVLTPNQVDGYSMFPTFNNDDVLLTNRVPEWIGTTDFGKQWDYQRGDIVVIKIPDYKKDIVKRVIGIPGDKVEIRDGRVIRNGQEITESYLTPVDLYTDYGDIMTAGVEITVKPNTLLLMGDNRTGGNSVDSRYKFLGLVERPDVIGKVIARVWPLSSLQLIQTGESH